MRITAVAFSALSAALLSSGIVNAQTGPYYNPANVGGNTTGYELYKTIGCPAIA